jgi:hypothetical protein
MGYRVQPEEVLIIMNDVSYSDDIVNAYIAGANATVNEVLEGQGLSADVMKEIERWLSAHLIALTRERVSVKEEAGTAKIQYSDIYGKGLEATDYGQMVLTLDTTGNMAATGGKNATVFAIPEFEE